ncbi:serine hydrolase [Lysinibacillus sp. NPDC097287]|uniref:serine hydrolase n=1 Tax=Lysinibacillus sp. NPDC097287 TaxID=3364144 RepID=UPI0037FBB0CA
MKIIFFIIAGILFILGLIMAIGFWMFQKETNKEDPDYIVQFIKKNAGNDNVSLSINYNGQKWVEVNEKNQLPLASTVKIIVAIEYAQQAAEGKINPEHEVSLEELNTFYVPPDGAHDAWISQLSKGKEIEKVPLSEVANGMIAYSSNANTDYLMKVLGIENINQVPESLGISNHQPIYPIVSALFIPNQLMQEKNLTKKETLEALKSMDLSEYRYRAIEIHKKWLSHPPTNQEKEQTKKMMDMDFQKIWSDRLPGSTTEDYVLIMDKLNSKEYYNENIHKYLDPVMEQLMKNPANREWLVHAGQKGGSTAFIVTNAMYATDKDGNKTELAFFSNDLNLLEQAKLTRKLNGFQLKFLTDAEFRTYVKEELSNL